MGLGDKLRKMLGDEPQQPQPDKFTQHAPTQPQPVAYSGRTVASNIGDKLPAYLRGAQPPTDGGQVVSLTKAAKVSVLKRPTFAGRTFAWYIMGDMSGSMMDFLDNGDLDYLTEAVLVVVEQNRWDEDGIIPAVPYATRAAGALEIGPGQSAGAGRRMRDFGYRNRIGGGTTYAAGIEAVVTHYQASPDWGQRPAIVVLQSDGMDNDPHTTRRKLVEYSRLPIHWVMVYFGDVDPNGNDQARFMRECDQGIGLEGRATDNVSLFIAGPQPKLVTPTELYDGLLDGPAKWLAQAPQDGVQLP